MPIKKYRLVKPPNPKAFNDPQLSFIQRGVLGYLGGTFTFTQRSGYATFTVLNVPLGELRSHAEMIAILDRLVETGWAEVVE